MKRTEMDVEGTGRFWNARAPPRARWAARLWVAAGPRVWKPSDLGVRQPRRWELS